MDYAELAVRLAETAQHMGPGWTVAASDNSRAEYELRRADGLTVCVSANGDGRLHVTGDWRGLYQFRPGGESLPDIHVGANREPQVIARDIVRRFLPAYCAMRVRLQARKAETDAHEARQRQIATDLLADSGGRLMTRHGSELELFSTGPWPTLVTYPVGVRIKVSGGSVEIRADDLSPEAAQRIMRVLYSYCEASAAGALAHPSPHKSTEAVEYVVTD